MENNFGFTSNVNLYDTVCMLPDRPDACDSSLLPLIQDTVVNDVPLDTTLNFASITNAGNYHNPVKYIKSLWECKKPPTTLPSDSYTDSNGHGTYYKVREYSTTAPLVNRIYNIFVFDNGSMNVDDLNTTVTPNKTDGINLHITDFETASFFYDSFTKEEFVPPALTTDGQIETKSVISPRKSYIGKFYITRNSSTEIEVKIKLYKKYMYKEIVDATQARLYNNGEIVIVKSTFPGKYVNTSGTREGTDGINYGLNDENPRLYTTISNTNSSPPGAILGSVNPQYDSVYVWMSPNGKYLFTYFMDVMAIKPNIFNLSNFTDYCYKADDSHPTGFGGPHYEDCEDANYRYCDLRKGFTYTTMMDPNCYCMVDYGNQSKFSEAASIVWNQDYIGSSVGSQKIKSILTCVNKCVDRRLDEASTNAFWVRHEADSRTEGEPYNGYACPSEICIQSANISADAESNIVAGKGISIDMSCGEGSGGESKCTVNDDCGTGVCIGGTCYATCTPSNLSNCFDNQECINGLCQTGTGITALVKLITTVGIIIGGILLVGIIVVVVVVVLGKKKGKVAPVTPVVSAK